MDVINAHLYILLQCRVDQFCVLSAVKPEPTNQSSYCSVLVLSTCRVFVASYFPLHVKFTSYHRTDKKLHL